MGSADVHERFDAVCILKIRDLLTYEYLTSLQLVRRMLELSVRKAVFWDRRKRKAIFYVRFAVKLVSHQLFCAMHPSHDSHVVPFPSIK